MNRKILSLLPLCLITCISIQAALHPHDPVESVPAQDHTVLGTTEDGKPITTENLQQLIEEDKLTKASLSGVDLKGVDLSGADLKGVDLRDANLWGAIMVEADLSEADLTGAILRGAILREADLSGAILKGADLSGADLKGANCRGADCREAYLKKAALWGADLSGTDFSGADVRRVDLSGLDFSELKLAKAIMYKGQALRLALNIKEEGIMTLERIEMLCFGYCRENTSRDFIAELGWLVVSFYYRASKGWLKKRLKRTV